MSSFPVLIVSLHSAKQIRAANTHTKFRRTSPISMLSRQLIIFFSIHSSRQVYSIRNLLSTPGVRCCDASRRQSLRLDTKDTLSSTGRCRRPPSSVVGKAGGERCKSGSFASAAAARRCACVRDSNAPYTDELLEREGDVGWLREVSRKRAPPGEAAPNDTKIRPVIDSTSPSREV